jgi:hypothetical protein
VALALTTVCLVTLKGPEAGVSQQPTVKRPEATGSELEGGLKSQALEVGDNAKPVSYNQSACNCHY